MLRIATEEASEILSEQPALAGYDSLEKAEQVREALRSRGIETRPIVAVGEPVAEPRSDFERRVYRDLGVKPGERLSAFGLEKIPSRPRKHGALPARNVEIVHVSEHSRDEGRTRVRPYDRRRPRRRI